MVLGYIACIQRVRQVRQYHCNNEIDSMFAIFIEKWLYIGSIQWTYTCSIKKSDVFLLYGLWDRVYRQYTENRIYIGSIRDISLTLPYYRIMIVYRQYLKVAVISWKIGNIFAGWVYCRYTIGFLNGVNELWSLATPSKGWLRCEWKKQQKYTLLICHPLWSFYPARQ